MTSSKKFSALENEIREGLLQDEAKQFEAAHEAIGQVLGFNAQNSEQQGDPDPRWIVEDAMCFVFEDHVKEADGSNLSLEKARQVRPLYAQQSADLRNADGSRWVHAAGVGADSTHQDESGRRL